MGFALYEDTEFIGGAATASFRHRNSRRSSVAPAGGLGLYEDTEFITSAVAAAAAAGGPPAANSAAGSGSAAAGSNDLGLGLYEDTEFITRAVPKGNADSTDDGAAAGGGGGLGLYQDTEFITARCLPSHVDGEQRPAPVQQQPLVQQQPQPAAVADELSKENGLPSAAAAPRQHMDQENIAAPERAWDSPARSATSAAVAFAQRCDSFEVMDSPEARRQRLEAAEGAGCAAGSRLGPASAGSSPDKVRAQFAAALLVKAVG